MRSNTPSGTNGRGFSGQIAIAGTGDELLANPKVGELFLGG